MRNAFLATLNVSIYLLFFIILLLAVVHNISDKGPGWPVAIVIPGLLLALVCAVTTHHILRS